VIPAGAAFGTGEHATTAMSLRFLEETTRDWGAQAASLHSSATSRREKFSEASAGSLRSPEKEFSLLDLGTGSGILALAGARFGAKRVIAIDNDPIAIATAKENAHRNRIDHVDFRVADVRRWKFPARIDIITANFFSELLIEILPKLKCAQWLIFSGVLRGQEAGLVRGKWVAMLARQNQGAAPSKSPIYNKAAVGRPPLLGRNPVAKPLR